MVAIYLCGIGQSNKATLIAELLKSRRLRNAHVISDDTRNVFEQQRESLQDRDSFGSLQVMLERQCGLENTHHEGGGRDMISAHSVLDSLVLACLKINKDAAKSLMHDNQRIINEAIQRYKKCILVLIFPFNADGETRIKLSNEKLKHAETMYLEYFQQYSIPFLNLCGSDLDHVVKVILEAFQGKLPLETSNLLHYDNKKQEKGTEQRSTNLSFYLPKPNKSGCISIPAITITEHKSEQEWKTFEQNECNRFIGRHGAEDLVIIAFHVTVKSRVVQKMLLNGITVNGQQYSFLGCSSSGLKKRKCYMLKGPPERTEKLIEENGKFDMKSVAKRMARIALLFSAVRLTNVLVENENIVRKDDICTADGKCFTDGCGAVGQGIATQLFKEVSRLSEEEKYLPSVYQIRYQGYKGVLALDPSLPSESIMVRPSMEKFKTSAHKRIGVCGFSRPHTFGHLNRQYIMLLSGLGVDDEVFQRKQKEHFNMVEKMTTDPEKAIPILQWQNKFELAQRLMANLKRGGEIDETVRKTICRTQSKLLSVSQKLRILIPKSRNIYGVCDTRGVLGYGQCFLRVTEGNIGSPKTIKGKVVVSKNPCYLLGDVRVLEAVDTADTEQLNHLVDCIVFPVRGKQPHPDEIAGSDLDGDMFFVSWDADLIPPQTKSPYDYPSAQVKPRGQISFEKMIKYFAYQNESQKLTAQVDRNYLEWANIKGVDSEECRELGMLFSRVIDSAKSGETFHSQDLKTPDEACFSSKQTKFIWEVLDGNAEQFKTKMTERVVRFPASFEVAEEFVLSIVTEETTNISEFDKFQFVWRYIDHIATEADEKVEIFLNQYSDHLNYALFSTQEKREVIGLGIPADIVTNALRKSVLLSLDDLDVFAMNSNPNRWKFYLRENYENINWMYLLKALTHHDKCLLVISLPDEVTIVLQFLGKQEQGEEQQVSPGTVSGYFYSKRFQYREKYVLGPVYTMDLTENRLQLYRQQDKRQTFVWLMATEQRKGKLQLGDEVLSSISVDLTRFNRQILGGSRRHPRVNKIPLVAIEVFVDNDSMTVPYFDTIEANDLEPVAETEDLEPEEDYETERDLSFMLSEEELDVYQPCGTEENLKTSLKRTIAEVKPLVFARLVEKWYERKAQIPSWVSELVVSLLENIVARSTPQHLPEQVTEAIRKILLSCEFHQLPLQLFIVAGSLSRIHLDDLAAERLIRDTARCKLDLSCLIDICSKWDLWWYMKEDIAKQSISNVVRTVALQLPEGENSEARNRMKYLLHVVHLHFLNLLQEIDTVKERMKLEKADCSISNLKLTASSRDNEGVLSFHRATALNHRPKITQGLFVAVTRQADFKKNKSHESCCCFGQVQTIRLAPLIVTVKLLCGQAPAIISENLKSEDPRLWKIDLMANITTFTRVMNAIKRLTAVKDPWVLNLLANPAGHPRNCPLFRENVQMEIPARETTIADLKISSKLNEKQRMAVHAALEQKFTLIQGPPGTGKTTLACEIIKQAKQLGKYKKILVVAETNVAVDNIAKKLRKDLPLDVLRLGTEEGVDCEVFDITLDGQLKQLEEKEAKKASYRDDKGILHRKPKLVEKILTNAKIFLTTCAGAGDALLDSETFEFVVVDEATQTKEPTLLCSLSRGVNQLVMIGDPKQLGPITVRQHNQQTLAPGDPVDASALSNTLFHRLYDAKFPLEFLDTQHRMHPALMEFPSETFYDGNLKCGPASYCYLPAIFKWPDPKKPLCFMHVDGNEERNGTSFCNRKEVRGIQLVLEALMNVPEGNHNQRLDITEIGIVTLYQGQAKLLSSQVKPKVEVRTVDGFQGREKEVIIVSTVRANERGALGFLESTNRLNVLLTRAKRGLIVVGHEGTLKNSPLWKKWIELAPHLSFSSLDAPDNTESQASGSKRGQENKGKQESRKSQDGRDNTRSASSQGSRQHGQPHSRGKDTRPSTSGRRKGAAPPSTGIHREGQGVPPQSRSKGNHPDVKRQR